MLAFIAIYEIISFISSQPTWLVVSVVTLARTVIYSLIKKFVKLAIYLSVLIILLIVIAKLLNLYL